MIDLLLLVNTVIVGMVVARAMLRADRFYEYPALAGLVYLGFVLPQAVALRADDTLPEGGLALTLLMALLCYLAVILGWKAGTASSVSQRPPRELDTGRMLFGVALLSLFGAFFSIKLRGLPAEMLQASQWTGLPVAYIFFAKTQLLAFAMAVLLYLRTRSGPALLIALFNIAFFLEMIIVGARREIAVETILVVLVGLWFCRGWVPPRSLLAVCAVGGILFVHSTGAYRGITTADPADRALEDASVLERIGGIDFFGSFLAMGPDDAPEMRNAAFLLAAYQAAGTVDLGASYWNNLIFNYVPAQLVGPALKASLTMPVDPPRLIGDYAAPTGSTLTGFADSFRAFWLLGFIVFFLIALLLGYHYSTARKGMMSSQFFYLVTATNGMTCFTHSTGNFISSLLYTLLFSMPIFYFSAVTSWAQPKVAPSVKESQDATKASAALKSLKGQSIVHRRIGRTNTHATSIERR